MEYKKKLLQLITTDPDESEQTARKKYGFFPFIILQVILFSLSIIVVIISLYISIVCFIEKITDLSKLKSIEEVITCFQPCITGFAMSQIFIVSAFTLSDLRVLWYNSEPTNAKEINNLVSRNSKTNLLMEFVLSSISLGFIIIINNVIKLNLEISQVLQITLFLVCLMSFIILMKEFILPIIYRYQARKDVGKNSDIHE